MPACAVSSASINEVSGVPGAGFRTTVQPAAKAGPIFQTAIIESVVSSLHRAVYVVAAGVHHVRDLFASRRVLDGGSPAALTIRPGAVNPKPILHVYLP